MAVAGRPNVAATASRIFGPPGWTAHDLMPATVIPRKASQSSSHGRSRPAITSGILFDSVIPNPWSPTVQVMASAASGIRHDPLAVSRQAPAGPVGAPTTAPEPSANKALATTLGGSHP